MTKSPLYLAVDVGASRTAAALARIAPDGSISATPFLLGRHSDSVPTAIFVGDGELLFGDAAVRRGLAQPERLIREFKRRIGDRTPLFAGDRRFTPEQLFALFVSWVVDAVGEREGQRPTALSVSVPATWGGHRTDVISDALDRAGWPDVRLISEPEAAAHHYAEQRALAPGSLITVYDLGGGTFDAALVRIDDGVCPEILDEPVGLDAFGGSDFDDAVLAHAVHAVGLSLREMAADEGAHVTLAALRREAIEAKEALSFDSEAVIPVLLSDGPLTVRLTRSELEEMIEDGIQRTVDVVEELWESTGVDRDDVTAVLLTGGSSRIPRVAQVLSERLGRPVAVDADPKSIVSLGAARAAAETAASMPLTATSTPDPPTPNDAPAVFERPPRRTFWLGRAATIAAVTGGAVVLSVGIAVAALSPGDESSTNTPQPSLSPAETTTPGPSMEPTSTSDPQPPLLTPAPPGVVTDIFPSETVSPTAPRARR